MILGDELGIGHGSEQHAAYVGSWIKALQDDLLEILRVAAEKIQDYVLGLEQKQVQEQTGTQAAAMEHPKAFIDSQGEVRDRKTDEVLPAHWQGVAKNEGAYWRVGPEAGHRSFPMLTKIFLAKEAGERSFTLLTATTFKES